MPSIAYKATDEELQNAVKNNTSIRQVLLSLNLNGTGSAYRVLKRRIKNLNLDTSHFTGKGYLKGKTHNWARKIPLKKILIKNSSYTSTTSLKNRLLKEGLLRDECYGCNLPPSWQGQPLTLQLDHINGQHDDHRLENLRLLCPNCHSQTPTFAGRNGTNGGT